MKVPKPFLTKLETYIDEYVKTENNYPDKFSVTSRYLTQEVLYKFLRELKRYK